MRVGRIARAAATVAAGLAAASLLAACTSSVGGGTGGGGSSAGDDTVSTSVRCIITAGGDTAAYVDLFNTAGEVARTRTTIYVNGEAQGLVTQVPGAGSKAVGANVPASVRGDARNGHYYFGPFRVPATGLKLRVDSDARYAAVEEETIVPLKEADANHDCTVR